MPVNLYYAQRIRGFQQESVKYHTSGVRYPLKRIRFQCSRCASPGVPSEPPGQRLVHGEPAGCCHEIIFEFTSSDASSEIWERNMKYGISHPG